MVAARFRGIVMALLLGALLVASSSVGWAQTVRDVPPNHWAYEAVMELVNRGYIAIDDGLFAGEQPVDRFTLATVVARLLHEVERGGVQLQSERDVQLIRSVATEFREDLVRAFALIERTGARVEAAEREVDVIREKISEVIDELEAVERRFDISLAEQDAKHQAELQAAMLQLQSSLTQLRELLDQRTDELAVGLRDEVLQLIADLRQENEDRVARLEANVRDALAQSGIALGGLQESLQADSARLRQLEEEVKSLSADLDALTEAIVTGVEQVLAEIRSELNAQAEALAAGQLALEELRAEMARQDQALADTDAELLKGIEAALERIASLQQEAGALETQADQIDRHVSGLEERLAALQEQFDALAAVSSRLDGVERQVLAMQSQIGLSEEQLRALSDRLMNELESQYQHSFLLAGTVSEELKALREEFNSYRQNTERELSSARQAQMFGLVGALLGLIGLIN